MNEQTSEKSPKALAQLSLGALGVVYGDIGTSPLYALKECFLSEHGTQMTQANVLGVLSLFFWSLTFMVAIKYLTFVLRADNKGEGGILALTALVALPRSSHKNSRSEKGIRTPLLLLGIVGAGLLLADGVLTPAISVLSAVEGLEVATPVFHPWVVPLTLVILIGLFLIQKNGTAKVGAVFGPTMLVWFIFIAAMGIPWILKHPAVLTAINPLYGIDFLLHHGKHGFLLLGIVTLCFTGTEALYADMGHFGRKPITLSWYVIFPALLLNYFGQGALIIEKMGSSTLRNPFFEMAEGLAFYPMLVIATFATIIASQALISGAFSLAQQAVQLGYLPRMTIRHTSETEHGQIYVPEINWLLMALCIYVVLEFQRSSNLASAYGLSVITTMLITSILMFFVARDVWGWKLSRCYALLFFFLAIDMPFFLANLTKLLDGAWLPMVFAGGMFAIMTTWKKGRIALANKMAEGFHSLGRFIMDISGQRYERVPGTAVFMTSNLHVAPPALVHHVKHNKVLHERIILLSITTESVPRVDEHERMQYKEVGAGIFQVTAHYGFMENPDVPLLLENYGEKIHRPVLIDDTSFYLGRELLLTTGNSGLSLWRKFIFVFLSRNARQATTYFNIPPDRVVELGMQVEL